MARVRSRHVTIGVYDSFRDFLVYAEDESGREVGRVAAARMRSRSWCHADAERLTKELRYSVLDVFAVQESYVTPEFYNTGLGVELYLAAAETAAKRHGSALVPHACDAGSTSEAARRVWNSRRFREQVVRSGQAVYWVGKHQ